MHRHVVQDRAMGGGVSSSNGDGNGRKQGSGVKERFNNQIEATAVAGDNNCHQHSTAEMDDGV